MMPEKRDQVEDLTRVLERTFHLNSHSAYLVHGGHNLLPFNEHLSKLAPKDQKVVELEMLQSSPFDAAGDIVFTHCKDGGESE